MIGYWLLWGFVVAVVAWQTRHALGEPLVRARAGLPPTAADNKPGAHIADHDECELIWSMPAFDPDLDAGCDRLRQALRDHREEEGL